MYEMPESERNRLIKLRRALLLAVSDMEQAIRAAQVLVLEEDDGRLARALETAFSVTYMRPFTQGSLGQLPAEYVPNAGGGEDVHAKLKDLRDKVYAHTDEESGRYAFVTATARQGNTVTIDFRESWLP